MYWRTGQYEILRGRAPRDRERLVREALTKHGRATGRRFLLALASWFGGTIAVFLHPQRLAHARGLALSDWRLWSVLAGGGVVFYAYLLWEINGPIRTAVEKVIAGQPAKKTPGRR